ncbi:pyrroline-5-carboxylate reductase [Novisyntrophococcus fermenticellae]|uniref:pyrroline-5-carboxylate reductase n=1 Tax=Novisyntrophococcus fermenticellae TaxID=2068655 RepID=UPI001E59C6B6|nr:pyrroline-5-carboxylate reductase [Novisyntrophococcus fermenticellae]
MKKSIGFIGSGNMGSAIIGGIISSHLVSPSDITAADISPSALESLREKFGIHTSSDNLHVAAHSDILFLSVKPNIYPVVIKEIKESIRENTIIVAIAAGQSIEKIEALFERDIKLAKVMPNTPALVGAGMAAISPNKFLDEEELTDVLEIFKSLGKAEVVPEHLMDVVTGISGSSPAYVYMFIEAMADAAVAEGMPRALAYEFSAQAVLGSAKMVLDTNQHPGALKDMVCSPGGTTIAAVCELERKGMRDAVISAVKVCTEKSREMGRS